MQTARNANRNHGGGVEWVRAAKTSHGVNELTTVTRSGTLTVAGTTTNAAANVMAGVGDFREGQKR